MIRTCRYFIFMFIIFIFCVQTKALSQQTPSQSPNPVTSSQDIHHQEISKDIKEAIDNAVSKVRPALVRIHVVSTYYQQGRETKSQSSGSGAIITPDGYVITNHHVAGHATSLTCTLSTKEEIDAKLIGTDPLTDIAIIKLLPDSPRKFPVAKFGDSSQIAVGQEVLAMGSPMSLSQSVTLGIISNAELVMPEWFGKWGGIKMDGENVGELVRWIGHDAQIFPGNSGGPLVNMNGEIIGINEISIGLGGAIPSNLAQKVAWSLIKTGKVRRAWLGEDIQPRLKSSPIQKGALISGTIAGSPAEKAGIKSGDILIRLAGKEVDVRFLEQLPEFNQEVANLPIGKPVDITVLRNGKELTMQVIPVDREKVLPPQHEIRSWGITVRNLSYILAREMKRKSTKGVLVTSIRPGGPADDAKPVLQSKDIIVKVANQPVNNVSDLKKISKQITQDAKEPVPTLVVYEREAEQYITVVKIGIQELRDPGLEVKKAWLPVETQVLTRDIARQIHQPDLSGFRITHVYENTTAATAGLKTGDYILAVDDEKLTARDPEDYDDLPQLIREYKVGSTVELTILRDGQLLKIPVTLMRSPRLSREMKKYRDDNFEFTVRDITFFDKAQEKWQDQQQGVLVEKVKRGGWADVALMETGDLLLEVNGKTITNVDTFKEIMKDIEQKAPQSVVFKILRGIHTSFLEIEPQWKKD